MSSLDFAVTQGHVAVLIAFETKLNVLQCDRSMTMSQVRAQWQAAIRRAPSVAFVTPNGRYLPDDRTIDEGLEQNPNSLSLELHAHPKSLFWIQVFGYEETRAPLEVATSLMPATVLREIENAVGVFTDDFRLTWNEQELDFERPFNAQGIPEGAELMLDLRITVNVHSGSEVKPIKCFGSETLGLVRQKVELGEDTVLVTTTQYRHILSDHLRVYHITDDLLDLQKPIDLSAEKKMMLSFEPIGLPHLRQQLPVAMSSTPLDVHDLLTESFKLTSPFRLTANGQKLDNCRPLLNQGMDSDTIFQLDILRPCKVKDRWMDLLEARYEDDEVCLYSTESSYGLFLRDLANEQHLMLNGIDLTLFGSMLDVFGPISGQHRSVLFIDRDVERSLPVLTFDAVERKLAWARSLLLEIVPTSRGLFPKEIFSHGSLAPAKSSLHQLRLSGDSLVTLDPLKVFVRTDVNSKKWSEKKWRIFRFAHGSTLDDVRAAMKQFKNCQEIGLKTRTRLLSLEEMDRKLDLELLLLTNESRFRTKLNVTVGGKSYGCWFEPTQVTFTDIMIDVGKEAKLLPRHLFARKLFCRGCGRQLSQEEEPHQVVPSNCCHVRSLELTDRLVKATGVQTAVPRHRDAATETLYPEERDACVNTSPSYKRILVNATRKHKRAVTVHPPPPPVSLHVWITSPDGRSERRTMSAAGGGTCRTLLAAVKKKFRSVPVGDQAVFFSQEVTYQRGEELRRAVECYSTWGSTFVDFETGSEAQRPFLLTSFFFHRPSSPLRSSRSSPTKPPYFFVETDTEFLTINFSQQLCAAPANALTDPTFVAALRGVRLGGQLFWELYKVRYVDEAKGSVYIGRSEIPKGTPKRHVFLMFSDGDPVPFVANQTQRPLLVLRRAGLKLRIEMGCVRATGAPEAITDIERWDYPTDSDSFLESFMAATRK